MTARSLKIWLLEFACKRKFHSLLKDFAGKVGIGSAAVNIEQDVPPIYVALCAVHRIVVTEFDIKKFPVAVSICSDIYDALPEDVVTYKLFAKVMTGLKMLTLFEMLKQRDKMVLVRLNEYFPRTGINHPKADRKIADRLGIAQMKFRKFFLALIANRCQCEAYMRSQYPQEYGALFKERVKEHVMQFISNVETELPQTPIEQISRSGQASELCSLLNSLRCPHVQNLLDIVVQVEQLSEQDVRELLNALCIDDEASQVAKESSRDLLSQLLNLSSDKELENVSLREKSINRSPNVRRNVSITTASPKQQHAAETQRLPASHKDSGDRDHTTRSPRKASDTETRLNPKVDADLRSPVPRAKIYKMKTLTPRPPPAASSPLNGTKCSPLTRKQGETQAASLGALKASPVKALSEKLRQYSVVKSDNGKAHLKNSSLPKARLSDDGLDSSAQRRNTVSASQRVTDAQEDVETDSVFADAASPKAFEANYLRSSKNGKLTDSPSSRADMDENASRTSTPASFHSCVPTPDSQKSAVTNPSRVSVTPRKATKRSHDSISGDSASESGVVGRAELPSPGDVLESPRKRLRLQPGSPRTPGRRKTSVSSDCPGTPARLPQLDIVAETPTRTGLRSGSRKPASIDSISGDSASESGVAGRAELPSAGDVLESPRKRLRLQAGSPRTPGRRKTSVSSDCPGTPARLPQLDIVAETPTRTGLRSASRKPTSIDSLDAVSSSGSVAESPAKGMRTAARGSQPEQDDCPFSPLPNIEQHLLPETIKVCLVILKRNKELELLVANKHAIYS